MGVARVPLRNNVSHQRVLAVGCNSSVLEVVDVVAGNERVQAGCLLHNGGGHGHLISPVEDSIACDLHSLASALQVHTMLQSVARRGVMTHTVVDDVVACMQTTWVSMQTYQSVIST
eukprot:TRINITY_DN6683_c0_g1_i4.p2 TRINITY_DN6683_c0_g1~~TRINITY_DN6683_c0_g1_i4.p2  ORF type:complete len:117 (-),score=6.31 TRINITY_DN6683_c0_g1_i4:169-519(-)